VNLKIESAATTISPHAQFVAQPARGVFVEGEPLYPGAAIQKFNHIQVCVRNPDCIKGYFRLRENPRGTLIGQREASHAPRRAWRRREVSDPAFCFRCQYFIGSFGFLYAFARHK